MTDEGGEADPAAGGDATADMYSANLGGTIIQAKAPIGYYDEDPDIVYVQKWNIVFD